MKFLNLIWSFIKGIFGAFTTDKGGHSARKWVAFTLVVCVCYVHFRFVDVSVAIEVMIIDLLFISLLLGLVTADNLIQLRMGRNHNEPKQEIKKEEQ